MKSRVTTSKSNAVNRALLAAAVSATLGAVSLPAHADWAENLLNSLRAKGILSESDYQQILSQARNEQGAAAAKQAAASAPAPATPGQASAGSRLTVSGTSFIDLTSIDLKTNGTRVAPSGASADIKRFYLALDHKFDSTWSGNLTTDANFIAADSETQLYIKKAYVQGSFLDGALWTRLGSANMPWVPFSEDLYGYRFVETPVVDRLKFGTSADWGVHVGGSAIDKKVDYALSAVNGNGYKNPSRSKSVDFEGRISFMPLKGLTVGAGFYDGYLGKRTEGALTQHEAQRWDALVAYVNPDAFRVGAEYFSTKNWTQVLLAPSDSSNGYSLWGSVNLSPKLGLFARYDSANLSKDLNPSFKDKYYNLGLSYAFMKNVTGAIAYKHEAVDGGAISTANGTIGSNAGAKTGRYDEIGVWTQVKF